MSWMSMPVSGEPEGAGAKDTRGGHDASLMTPLGLVEGDALVYLEMHGATAIRRLVRELEWPAPMIMMAVGALVRDGLVRAIQHDLEVIVELRTDQGTPATQAHAPSPEGWGG